MLFLPMTKFEKCVVYSRLENGRRLRLARSLVLADRALEGQSPGRPMQMSNNATMTTARDVIEYMAAGMYGKNWNSDDPEKRSGERMKNVWREYARDALSGALSAPDSVRQELAALLNPWREIETAPKDGSAFLAYGVHTTSPPDAQRGVKPG